MSATSAPALPNARAIACPRPARRSGDDGSPPVKPEEIEDGTAATIRF